jgi:hypothetical protein
MATTSYLSQTQTSGNRKTFTYSTWVKRCNTTNYEMLFNVYTSGGNYAILMFHPDGYLEWDNYEFAQVSRYKTTPVYRDPSAFYHIVLRHDTTQATASDRIRIYVNGEEVTSFSTETDPSQNADTLVNNSNTAYIGRGYNDTSYAEMIMTHTHFCDGYSYAPSEFGETDATTGIWKPKTAPSVTYGTNGFFLKFENSGSMGTDSSGNANNFTVNGTMTQTVDTPSNVFATLNALANYYSSHTFSNGNTTIATSSSTARYSVSTLGVSQGKYYFEAKLSAFTTGSSVIGIESDYRNDPLGGVATGYGYWQDGQKYNSGTLSSYGDSYTTNDIIGVAVDLDNRYIYFAKNGTWQNSGDPTSGASGTGAAFNFSSADQYFMGAGNTGTSPTSTWQTNFGNGYFGTTQVSSAQNPDDGIGIFEYDVPTGYRALCTKSINAEEYS